MTALSNDPLYPPRFSVFLHLEWPPRAVVNRAADREPRESTDSWCAPSPERVARKTDSPPRAETPRETPAGPSEAALAAFGAPSEARGEAASAAFSEGPSEAPKGPSAAMGEGPKPSEPSSEAPKAASAAMSEGPKAPSAPSSEPSSEAPKTIEAPKAASEAPPARLSSGAPVQRAPTPLGTESAAALVAELAKSSTESAPARAPVRAARRVDLDVLGLSFGDLLRRKDAW
jgi:hypothetical protein